MIEENNFGCSNCKKEYYIPSYKFIIRGERSIYLDKRTNKEITCPNCKNILQFIPKKVEGEISFNIGEFSSLSVMEKQALLRKRSKIDNKKKKYVDNERERVFYNG